MAVDHIHEIADLVAKAVSQKLGKMLLTLIGILVSDLKRLCQPSKEFRKNIAFGT